jgi:hypothetical protein
MRDAGISTSGISADLGGIEDEAPEDLAGVDGGDGTAPETVTGKELGQTPSTEQTV